MMLQGNIEQLAAECIAPYEKSHESPGQPPVLSRLFSQKGYDADRSIRIPNVRIDYRR